MPALAPVCFGKLSSDSSESTCFLFLACNAIAYAYGSCNVARYLWDITHTYFPVQSHKFLSLPHSSTELKKQNALPHCFQIVMTLSIVSNLSFLSAYLGHNCIATLPVPIVSGGTAKKKQDKKSCSFLYLTMTVPHWLAGTILKLFTAQHWDTEEVSRYNMVLSNGSNSEAEI